MIRWLLLVCVCGRSLLLWGEDSEGRDGDEKDIGIDEGSELMVGWNPVLVARILSLCDMFMYKYPGVSSNDADDGNFCELYIVEASWVKSEELDLGLSFKDDGLLQ